MTPISEGRLTFEGIDYTRFSPDRVAQMGIARTFQSVRLLPGMSVLENVKLGADMGKGRTLGVDWWLGRRKARDMERGSITAAEDSINAVGLTDLIATSAGELSYGLQRLVEIARCLAMHPKVILLDEPTAGMPEGERDQVSSVISSVCAAGVTVVLVEHNVRMISQVSTEVIVLHLGACIARGTANDVLAQPDVRTAFLGNSGDEGLVQVDA
jgi:branched-chain amino acid transport system ATP-binding protein